jgi:hypothetical protein
MDYEALNARSKEVFANNVKWWTDLKTGESTVATRNRPEMMMLVVTELSEANDGLIHCKMDDKLPHRPMVDVELADAAIRLHDLMGAEGIDVTSETSDAVEVYLADYESLVDSVRTQGGEKGVTLTEYIMSVVDLISEAMEGYRKQTKMEMRYQYEFGIAKALLAIYDIADQWGVDIEGSIAEKLEFNKVRPDHQTENRLKEGGKAC